MYSYNTNNQSQNSLHTLNIKNVSANNPMYITTTQTQRESTIQKVSQQIDIKNIGILILGKAIIIVLYFTCSDFKLLDFMFVTITVSIDFWLNKNIYGKKLAGLRWWIELDQYSQEQHWVFESADPNIEINSINNSVFWFSNLIVATFWFINFIVILIITNSLFWTSLCIFSCGMTLINLLCFYKCRGNHQKKAKQIMQIVGLRSATHLLSRVQNMRDQEGMSSSSEYQNRDEKSRSKAQK